MPGTQLKVSRFLSRARREIDGLIAQANGGYLFSWPESRTSEPQSSEEHDRSKSHQSAELQLRVEPPNTGTVGGRGDAVENSEVGSRPGHNPCGHLRHAASYRLARAHASKTPSGLT